MLNLLDRQTIEDLTVYRDDQDVRKFYVLPDTPTIAQDPQGRPRFLFVKYVDDRPGVAEADEKNGAYTQFHATLAIGDERRERVLQALRERLQEEKRTGFKPFGKAITSTEPLLARPDWTDGSITLSTFEASETGMVRSVAGSKKPDLAGDLGAAFALELDDAGAAVFADAFESGNVPIVLAYELTYKARVPAAKMIIHAEREKVQKEIWSFARPFVFKPALKRYTALAPQSLDRLKLLNLRAVHGPSVRAMVSRKMVTVGVRNVIDVQIQSGEGGSEDSSVREKLMEIAADILSNNIIPAFFAGNQILSQLTDVEDGDDLLELKDDIESSLEPFHIELSEEVAVDRQANPSGIIQMLLTDEQRSLAFRETPLSDPFFQQLDVEVIPTGMDFERDGIDSIHVFLEYDHTDTKTGNRVYHALDDMMTVESPEVRFELERLARGPDGLAILDYRIRTEIYYSIDIPKSVGQWMEKHDRTVPVAPRALGALRVELVLTARPESIESAEVHLSYRTSSGELLDRTLTLTTKESRKSWFQFTGEFGEQGREPTYQYQVVWTLPGGAKLRGSPSSSKADVLEIATPFSTPLTFTIRPQGTFEGVKEISGELHYEDQVNDYRVVRSFSLTAASASQVFDVSALEGGPREAKIVNARIQYTDGTHKELAPLRTEPGTVWLGEAVTGSMTIRIQPFQVDFERDVMVAIVVITYTHADGKVDKSPAFNLRKGDASVSNATEWEVTLGEGDPQTFSYTVNYVDYDRRRTTVTKKDVEDPEIWLEGPPPPDAPA
ncbi:MAG: hypothetical protein H6712_23255 [Myxococcales bacterium]|nr:hypothetical protein [Myxococcales bacterium]